MLPILCLMGPTAAGKTALAVEIIQHFPCEIISVDSAMVYKGLDIGTAKPEADLLKIAPHRLIDIRDPAQPYSAGEFYNDVFIHIEEIIAKQRIPLLVGGTMLYFRVLEQGLAPLPSANTTMRLEWQSKMEKDGLASLHAQLMLIDPVAANRIHIQDKQRIQRALEVFHLTGKTISTWQKENIQILSNYRLHFLGLVPQDRLHLHKQIELRFQDMLAKGFIEEVRALYQRGDLSQDLPAIRAVGYKQAWDYLSGKDNYQTMCAKAICATRQLAKRQLTWLRTWPALIRLNDDRQTILRQIDDCLTNQSK